MSKHNETGIKGEHIARNFLQKKGYKIVHSNWRFGKKEVDIIAMDNDMLVFIEVKTRSSFDFGFPEEAVSIQKQAFLKIAAEAYLDENLHIKTLRFDIISILLYKEEIKEIRHFEDAFY
jgi:putative endonuclease